MSVIQEEIENAKKQLLEGYYTNLNILEMTRYKEINSAKKIQRAVKTYLAGKKMSLLKNMTLEIQKNLKGFFERESFNLRRNMANSNMNLHFFKYHVEKIQYQ